MNARKFVFVLCVFLVLSSALAIPAPALAQAPVPQYIPAFGEIVLGAQSASVEQNVCSPGQAAIRPFNPLAQAQISTTVVRTNSLFMPALLNGEPVQGDMCTDLDPYLGGSVLLSDQVVIPIIKDGKGAFEIGDLDVTDLSYIPNQPVPYQEMWDRLHGQLPTDLKSLKLIAAWNITDPSAVPTVAQNIDGPVDVPQLKDGLRAKVMDKMIQEGLPLDFSIPTTSIVRRIPDKYRDLVEGQYNALSINTICPGVDQIGLIDTQVAGFVVLTGQGPLGNEIVGWAYLDYGETLGTMCPLLELHPWLLAADAFRGLEFSARRYVDDRVDDETLIWPKREFSLFGNPALQPVPPPVMAEGTVSAFAWGAVVLVAAIFVIGAATGQPEVWLFAFAVP